jgi:uncharacterized damage-inducible protein DinB
MKSNELSNKEYSTFNATYIHTVNESVELIDGLKKSRDKIVSILENLPIEKFNFRYAEGKWTIKDIIQHIIDAERIFSYRALRIARNDQTPLAGFNENEYAENTNAHSRNWNDLVAEFKLVRQTTIMLFKSFSEEQLVRVGTASNHSISVRAIGFVILGHQLHHYKVIKERYL